MSAVRRQRMHATPQGASAGLHLVDQQQQRHGDPPIFYCAACDRLIVHQSSDPAACPCGAEPCADCAAKVAAMVQS